LNSHDRFNDTFTLVCDAAERPAYSGLLLFKMLLVGFGAEVSVMNGWKTWRTQSEYYHQLATSSKPATSLFATNEARPVQRSE